MGEHVIGAVDDFPVGRGSRVEVDGIRMAVFRFDDDQFYAVSDYCPHKGAPLSLAGSEKYPAERFRDESRGEVDQARRLVKCPWHDLEFELDSGDCPVGNYRIGTFDVTVVDQQVTVTL